MSEAYRIKKFYHVTGTKHKRLRDENLVPLIALLPLARVISEDIDDMLTADETMMLKMNEIDTLEEQLHTIQNLLEGDWFIDYTDDEQTAYIMKFKRYIYYEHKHLYIKHFGQVSSIFKVKPLDMPEELRESLSSANHLETLPLNISMMLDKYEVLALAEERQAQETALKKTGIRRPKPHKVTTKTTNSRNGEVKVVRAAYLKP